jgi:hypothetical protein
MYVKLLRSRDELVRFCEVVRIAFSGATFADDTDLVTKLARCDALQDYAATLRLVMTNYRLERR